jgi:histidine triad (HIT) family protein
MIKTLFEKIIDRELPAEILYEDDLCIAIVDKAPQAPVHILLISKKRIHKLADVIPADAALMGHMLVKVPELANKLHIQDNFRLVINNGPKAGQTIYHLHLHIMAGRNFDWPPG